MIVACGIVLAGGIGLPHLLSLQHASPGPAAAIWLAALVLRAVAVVLLALSAALILPSTDAYVYLTHWCWHAVLPLLTTHLGVEGHNVGGAAVVLPSLVLAASVLSVTTGLLRSARAVRCLLVRQALGVGPMESLVVGGPEVLVAAAGLAHPRVVVSAGALVQLDDAELAAGVAHERGHIARQHRFVLLVGEFCRCLGRFIPGTARAMRELTFHLERDADRYALACRHDPIDLASAICKAAGDTTTPALATLGRGPNLAQRVEQLIERRTPGRGRPARLATSAIAAVMLGLTLGLTALVPVTVASGLAVEHVHVEHCHHD
jgi:Peptidase family M48